MSDFDEGDDEYGLDIHAQEDVGPLQQLQLYQFVIRKWCPLLDAYETAVLIQLVDRITGWKKDAARFSQGKLWGGDAMYGGLARTMHRSRMIKALASLERRGFISRVRQSNGYQIKIYRINYDAGLEQLSQSAPARRRERDTKPVANGDRLVHLSDRTVAAGDQRVSDEGPREEYPDNGNRHYTQRPDETAPFTASPAARSRTRAAPTAPTDAASLAEDVEIGETMRAAQARPALSVDAPQSPPPPRRRIRPVARRDTD